MNDWLKITEIGPEDSIIFHFEYLDDDAGQHIADGLREKRVACLSADEVHVIIIRGARSGR